MEFRKLFVLLWKHLVVRMRRFIHTPVEIFSPILLILIMFCFHVPFSKNNRSDNYARAIANPIKTSEVVPLGELVLRHPILYTPNSALASELMDEVGKKLSLNRTTQLPGHGSTSYYGFSNISEVIDFMSKLRKNEAIVFFDDLDRDAFPDKLSYTIRMKDSPSFSNTDDYDTSEDKVKGHRNFGTDYESFMRLQWTLDTSFLKLKSGTEVKEDISIQEFPFYSRHENVQVVMYCEVLKVLCWASLCMAFVFLMSRLLEERSTGIQELIKMVGVSNNLLAISHFINVLPAGLIYSVGGAILLKATASPIIPHSDGSLIFIALFLHYLSVVAMAFACSYITGSTSYTTSLSVTAYVASWLPARWADDRTFSALLPHKPIEWFWNNVQQLEVYGSGLTYSNMSQKHSPISGSVLLAFACCIVQIAFFFALSWYLSHVRPGQYGQALPWNFLFQKQYWTRNEVKPSDTDSDEELPIAHHSKEKYFENPPKNMEAGIRIQNVTKIFPKHKALNNVTMDVYKGEITVLLGHNGAGKTTLMSIITGMMSATSGQVFVNGLDSSANREAVRKQLGLCPQHNLFFEDFTVLEHVVFFTLLKGGTYKEARSKAYQILGDLGIRDKANQQSSALSGGMKRRLQLACALAGDASVLVLDEPTSGLDVETRRGLWDLLLSLRGERTVLISTHFMEEADALGDRVAALHLGNVKCHATPMYLKRAIGTGYRLSFTTSGLPREQKITDVVTHHIADASLKDKTINSLTYNLPAASSDAFPALFTDLENKKLELGIETIGVGVSTLDDVFLKLCSDTDVTFSEDEVDSATTENPKVKIVGFPLYMRQFVSLLKRQFYFVMDKKISFSLLQLIIPIAMICVFTVVFQNYQAETPPPDRTIALNLGLYSDRPDKAVYFDVTGASTPSLRTMSDAYPQIDFEPSKNITADVLRTGEASLNTYAKYLAGIEMKDAHVKVLYTTVVRHAAPVAVNLATNLLASGSLPRADGRTFTARLHPVTSKNVYERHTPLKDPKDVPLCALWCGLLVFVILSTNINFVSLPCRERVTGTRHIHVMSGCPVTLHWAATLCFHAAVAVATLVLTTALACLLLEHDNTLDQGDFVGTLILTLTLGCMAFFAFMYLVSLMVAERAASIILVTIIILFGLVTVTTSKVSEMFSNEKSTTYYLLLVPWATMPPHTIALAVFRSLNIARLNAQCSLNRDHCPNLFITDQGFDSEKCCAGLSPRCYLCADEYSAWKELVILSLQFVVYMTLVILAEMGLFSLLWTRLVNGPYRNSTKSQPAAAADDLVRAEAVYVDKQIALPTKQIEESKVAMMVNNLHKTYYRLFGKPCHAVKGISFSVKKGECFGLLGVNGAGKSTTFNMITAGAWPSAGQTYANGYHREDRPLSATNFKYLRSLGYCPQFSGLDSFLTGRDNLALLLTMRGFTPAHLESEVDHWIQVVGLEKYKNRKVSGYSGGCARRLAAAGALCAGAAVAVLDEPTAGVDVAARRRVWAALRRGLARHQAIVISSHSMEEIEALCGRVAIMAGGVIRAMGSGAELRARHAAGHALIIKLGTQHHTDRTDQVDSPRDYMDDLKSMLHATFNCTLKDEHKTMLHYHINETVRYSELFSSLERLRGQFPALVEDYSVTETTLEEVFLAFAREQDAPQHNNIV